MDLEILWKAIVPLAFLAIWALTALFNRDGQALPARARDQAFPPGPKPAPTPLTRPNLAATRPAPTVRWNQPPSSPRPVPRAGGDDDIIILESSKSARPTSNKGIAPTRRTKQKPVTTNTTTPSIQPKLGFEGVAQNVNQQLTSPLSLRPLSQTDVPTASESTAASSSRSKPIPNAPTRTLDIMAALGDPSRIREAMLVNELLQPPLSLRNRRR